jgi:hypothetical protein
LDDVAGWFERFSNRKIYHVVTVDVLDQLADSDLEQALIDYVGTKIGNDFQRQREIAWGLKPGLRALYITWLVEAEVNNGGFNQFYWNSAGQFASDAPDAFAYFSAQQHAELMREANRVRAAEANAIKKYQDLGTVKAFSASYGESKLEPLDDRFYRLGENLSALRVAKIRANPGDFIGS